MMFKNLSLRTKLLSTLHVSVFTICMIFLIFGITNVNNFLKKDIAINNRVAQENFNTLENRDNNMLSSNLTTFIANEEIKKVYLTNDRDKLYDVVEPLFNDLKTKYGITHLYFIDTDGKVFLRMHKKDEFGDEVTRYSFAQARDHNVMSSSIELGKTAYALRVVSPYYQNGKLIGYVEMAEEINHFIDLIKEEGSLIYVASKTQVKKDDYLKVYGEGNYGWNYFNNYVIVSKLPSGLPWEKCVTEENINETAGIFNDSKRINADGKIYSCGSFPIYVGNKISGYVFDIKDMSERNSMANDVIYKLAFLCIAVSVMFAVMIVLIFNRTFKYYNNIIDTLNKIKQGNYDVKLPIHYHDEIGEVSEHINEMSSEIKTQKESLKEMNARLILENNIKNEFISMASHELLTPTSIIEGYSSMILDDKMAKLDSKSEKYLSKISISSRRLAELVKEILDVSRIEQNRIVIKKYSFNVLEVISNLSELVGPKIKNKNLRLKFNCTHKKVYVYADKDKTTQIILNLLDNAIKYTNKGTIEIGCEKVDFKETNCLAISVKDEGIGIPEIEQKQLFQKFFRASNGAEKCDGGSGLGLYISKQYAEIMGGDIKFKDMGNKGSTFTLYLKLATPEQIKHQSSMPKGPDFIRAEKK